MEHEQGPLGVAMAERDKQESDQLLKASKIVGNVLSGIEMRSPRYPMLFDIMIKLRGLVIDAK